MAHDSYFKPTRDFNADDVLFSFNRMRLKSHPFHMVGGGNYEYFEAMQMGKVIKDVKKLGPYRIQFILTRPDAPFVSNLSMDFASITSAEYAAKLAKAGKKDDYITKPVGTGPFVFKKYVKDQTIRYTSHPHYWRGKSPLDQLVFVITPDPSVRYQKLKTGECHLIGYPSPNDLAAMKKNPKLKVVNKPGLNIGYLSMNVEKTTFQQTRCSKSGSHGLEPRSYMKAIYLGNAVIAKNPLPPTSWAYNKKIRSIAHNTKKAKALLKKAGYPNGFETELWTLPVSRPYNPNGKKMGEMMQADLAKIGIKAKLVTYDWPTYLQKTQDGEHSLAQFGWSGDNGDPDNFLDTLLACSAVKSGSNRSRWCDPSYEKLVKAAKVNSNKGFRKKKYLKAQTIFKKQVPWVTIAHSMIHSAMSKKVKNYKIDPMGHEVFYGVDLAD